MSLGLLLWATLLSWVVAGVAALVRPGLRRALPGFVGGSFLAVFGILFVWFVDAISHGFV